MEDKEEKYPQHVIDGILRALKEAEEGKLTKFTSVRDMIYDKDDQPKERKPFK